MIRWIVLAVFVFSFSDSRGQVGLQERLWSETGYNFKILFETLNAEYCYKSEKRFVGCMMAFHTLLVSAKSGEPHQLRVSDLNDLEIVPLPGEEQPKDLEEALEFKKRRRESFRSFYRAVTRGGGDNSLKPQI